MTSSSRTAFPFSAVVGADMDAAGGLDPMALALILTSISPEVGGVLVRGEKGTAKSTIVRALAAVLPPVDDHQARLVELPIGATEDGSSARSTWRARSRRAGGVRARPAR